MSKHSKKMISADLFAENKELFRCPICFGPMRMVNLKSLICIHHHCFDISKQGYVNFLSRAIKSRYDQKMFESRRIICRSGFYERMYAVISDKINIELHTKSERTVVLDAGCGEGSHLSNIQEKIIPNTTKPLLAIGMDISKEGINSAAMEYPNAFWCVADIANCPFAHNQFDYILNILSPANYSEFQRMISDEGMVIKVIPDRDYLKELRDIFYEGTKKQDYSNDNTLNVFSANLELTAVERVRYSFPLDKTLIESLLHMTPLSWGTTEEQLQKVQEMNLNEVTIDLTVMFGKKHNHEGMN